MKSQEKKLEDLAERIEEGLEFIAASPQSREEELGFQVSDRAIAHHLRYFGTSGFKNPDGSSRVPTEQEVVDLGWEPESYLTSPIPTEPRAYVSGFGKTRLQDK